MIKKGCVSISMQLHTGIDYLMELPVDDLNEIAGTIAQINKEVARRGVKK